MSIRVCKLQSQKSILERGWEKVTYWHIVSKTFIEVNIKCFFLFVCFPKELDNVFGGYYPLHRNNSCPPVTIVSRLFFSTTTE